MNRQRIYLGRLQRSGNVYLRFVGIVDDVDILVIGFLDYTLNTFPAITDTRSYGIDSCTGRLDGNFRPFSGNAGNTLDNNETVQYFGDFVFKQLVEKTIIDS